MGIRRVLLSGRARDQGRILENVVYLELLRRNGSVYVGRVGEREIDFVANNKNGRAYYQVSETVTDPRTLERELTSPVAIRDDYLNYLPTMDDADPVSHEGILQVNVFDWLMGEI